MKKTLLKSAILFLATTSLFVAPVATTFAQDDEVIATIGDKSITKEDLYQAMKNISGNEVLRRLILEQVLSQSVNDVDAIKKTVEDDVQKQIDSAGGEEVFQQLLDYQQIGSIAEFKYQMYVSKMFEEVIKKQIDMSDEAIQKFYDEQYQPLMEAQHILVDTEEEAQKAIDRINNGEEFDAVAKEVSKDSTAQNGGLLSPFAPGQMVPEFEEAVKSLENGQMTQKPVKTDYGYHVIKVINNGKKQPLDKVRKEVEDQYIQFKFADTKFSYGVVADLIEKAGYEIKDKDLKSAIDVILNAKNQPDSSQSNQESSTESSSAAPAETTAAEETTAAQ